MLIQRGEIWWANLRDPIGSEPGFRRPVLVLSNDAFNASCLQTVVVVCLTSNMVLRDYSGNVVVSAGITGLIYDSVVNMTQILTVDKVTLTTALWRRLRKAFAECSFCKAHPREKAEAYLQTKLPFEQKRFRVFDELLYLDEEPNRRAAVHDAEIGRAHV